MTRINPDDTDSVRDALVAIIEAGNALASAGYQGRPKALYEWRRTTRAYAHLVSGLTEEDPT